MKLLQKIVDAIVGDDPYERREAPLAPAYFAAAQVIVLGGGIGDAAHAAFQEGLPKLSQLPASHGVAAGIDPTMTPSK